MIMIKVLLRKKSCKCSVFCLALVAGLCALSNMSLLHSYHNVGSLPLAGLALPSVVRNIIQLWKKMKLWEFKELYTMFPFEGILYWLNQNMIHYGSRDCPSSTLTPFDITYFHTFHTCIPDNHVSREEPCSWGRIPSYSHIPHHC